MSIRVDWPRAKLRGVTPNTRITKAFRDRPAGNAIDGLIRTAGLATMRQQIDGRGRVVISDQFPLHDRVLDCRDLFAKTEPAMVLQSEATLVSWFEGSFRGTAIDDWQRNGGHAILRVDHGFLTVHQSDMGQYLIAHRLQQLRDTGGAQNILMHEPWRRH